jgi:ABC-type nickel/cobalt efflux system permease component RcnA
LIRFRYVARPPVPNSTTKSIMNDYYPHQDYSSAANASDVDRATFIRQTYLHVAGALGAFIVLQTMLMATPLAPALAQLMMGGRFSWLVVIGLFMLVSHIANQWALSDSHREAGKPDHAGLRQTHERTHQQKNGKGVP